MTQQQRPKFTYLGHATVRCDLPDGKVVLIDPWVDQNPGCPESCKSFDHLDAVLITHGHFDHMGDAVEICKRYQPEVVVANFEICQWLQGKGVANCSGMNTGGCQEVLGLKVWLVRADHSSGIQDGDRVVYGGDAGGFVVQMDDRYTFYHAGDTALFSDMQLFAEMWRPELAFLPIGDLFTMDPRQAARACRYLGIRKVVPIHWGTFPVLTGTPDQLQKALSDLGVTCEVVRLLPGESY
jgi:L-ascorbate metabolism protein UlaG (beta-lactamase superfamily)